MRLKMSEKRAVTTKISKRYQKSGKKEKTKILNEYQKSSIGIAIQDITTSKGGGFLRLTK